MEPNSTIVVTLRLIRSFEHRNIRHLVIRDVDLDQPVGDFLKLAKEKLQQASNLPAPFRNYDYDCFKIEHQAFGAKTNDVVMNLDNDAKLILQSGKSLRESGVKNETELSFFKYKDYESFKKNPHLAW